MEQTASIAFPLNAAQRSLEAEEMPYLAFIMNKEYTTKAAFHLA